MNKKNLLTWILFFLSFFLIAQFFTKKEQPRDPAITNTLVSIIPSKYEYSAGEEVIMKVRNNTSASVILKSNCPRNPFKVFVKNGDNFDELNAETRIDCNILPDITLEKEKEINISYTYWNHALFGNPARYKIEAEINMGTTSAIFSSPEFTVAQAGVFRRFFRTIFYQPIYNVLIFLIRIAPSHDLGIAIILLTLIIRLILLVPSQRAINSQRKMQELQPRLENLKKKYAGNQERIAKETLQLWKEYKVNPFGSCLPIIIQFPVLIALFYVIQNGLNPDNSYLLYGFLKNVDLTNIHTNFLGILELTKINAFVLPLIVGSLQFIQIKLSMLKRKKAGEEPKPKGSEMETVNKSMMYVMPVMIALFTVSVPAGVGLYWGISTLFAIGQQLIANKHALQASSMKKGN